MSEDMVCWFADQHDDDPARLAAEPCWGDLRTEYSDAQTDDGHETYTALSCRGHSGAWHDGGPYEPEPTPAPKEDLGERFGIPSAMRACLGARSTHRWMTASVAADLVRGQRSPARRRAGIAKHRRWRDRCFTRNPAKPRGWSDAAMARFKIDAAKAKRRAARRAERA